jgi:oligopeptide/dipeptide ABC transporter ATP-binding protein
MSDRHLARPLVEIQKLRKYFPLRERFLRKETRAVRAVDGVSFDINEGETFGLVGESGSGKTTIGRLAIRLLYPSGGTVRFEGRDIFRLGASELRTLRREMQIVFQDPFASLNPRRTVRATLSQPFKIHEDLTGGEVETRVLDVLNQVGLSPAESIIDRFPHEFSGGQRQRIGIARAIALKPKFIVADEPVSALDTSVRAQILNLLNVLQAKYHLTYLFITHELAVVRSISDTVGVMYLGKIVEIADVEELFSDPLHPYTAALLSATPMPDPKTTRIRPRITLEGDVPSPIDPPAGCPFHPRCRFATSVCRETEPVLEDLGHGHLVSCHHSEEIKPKLQELVSFLRL